ncbi:MAG: hypothetical protein FWH37_08325 [Candidatus Bathyarchaeota archaeon]|nr:hypothetical protein [Candidatus Termiticorpusculum sp.]
MSLEALQIWMFGAGLIERTKNMSGKFNKGVFFDGDGKPLLSNNRAFGEGFDESNLRRIRPILSDLSNSCDTVPRIELITLLPLMKIDDSSRREFYAQERVEAT